MVNRDEEQDNDEFVFKDTVGQSHGACVCACFICGSKEFLGRWLEARDPL